jgi:hypothetical protein
MTECVPSYSELWSLLSHLLHCKAGVDSSPVHRLALLIQPPHRGAHTLGADSHHIDIVPKLVALGLEVPQKEPVRQPQGGAGLHGTQNFLVVVGLQETRGQMSADLVVVGVEYTFRISAAPQPLDMHNIPLPARKVSKGAEPQLFPSASIYRAASQRPSPEKKSKVLLHRTRSNV